MAADGSRTAHTASVRSATVMAAQTTQCGSGGRSSQGRPPLVGSSQLCVASISRLVCGSRASCMVSGRPLNAT